MIPMRKNFCPLKILRAERLKTSVEPVLHEILCGVVLIGAKNTSGSVKIGTKVHKAALWIKVSKWAARGLGWSLTVIRFELEPSRCGRSAPQRCYISAIWTVKTGYFIFYEQRDDFIFDSRVPRMLHKWFLSFECHDMKVMMYWNGKVPAHPYSSIWVYCSTVNTSKENMATYQYSMVAPKCICKVVYVEPSIVVCR